MSTTTTNFGLIKPELTDVADITAMNENWDTIDAELQNRATLDENGKVPEDQLPDTTYIPVTSEVPEDSDIWIDPDDETVEENHLTDKNNPHEVTAEQVGAYPAKEVPTYPGTYWRDVDGVKESINPAMVGGVEYRTTERWRNKVVYAMIVYCGEWADNKQINVNLNNNQWVNVISSSGMVSGYALPFIYNGDISHANTCLYTVEGSAKVGAAIRLFGGGNTFTGKETCILIKYTKD